MENNNQTTEELQLIESTEVEIITEDEPTEGAAIEGKPEDGPETLGEGEIIGEPLPPDGTETELPPANNERKHTPLIPSKRK